VAVLVRLDMARLGFPDGFLIHVIVSRFSMAVSALDRRQDGDNQKYAESNKLGLHFGSEIGILTYCIYYFLLRKPY
jgi:hypothetical protein